MKHIALYIRVSTEEQAVHGLSIEAQTEALDAWAKQNKAKVVEHYVDAGISARKKASKRPELQRLLSDVRSGKIDMIVFTKLDRWFRNISEYYKVQEILDDCHVGWKTIHEDYDTTTASGRLKINIMLSVAQDEADRTSERIKAVFATKRERGEPTSGTVPYGYCIIDKIVQIDEKTAPVVRTFLQEYLSGKPMQKAINVVEQETGVNLPYWRVDGILRNPAYYGGKWGGAIGMCPAYMTDEQHQQILQMRRRVTRSTKSSRVYLFSGLLFCAECGHRFGAHTIRDKYLEYYCVNRNTTHRCGNRVNIDESDIEKYLLEHIDLILLEYAEELNTACSKRRDHSAEIAKLNRKITRLKELYLNDLIELDAYKQDFERFTSELDKLESEQQKTASSTRDLKRVQSAFSCGWHKLYADMSRDERREFWVVSDVKIKIFNDRNIEIYF